MSRQLTISSNDRLEGQKEMNDYLIEPKKMALCACDVLIQCDYRCSNTMALWRLITHCVCPEAVSVNTVLCNVAMMYYSTVPHLNLLAQEKKVLYTMINGDLITVYMIN